MTWSGRGSRGLVAGWHYLVIGSCDAVIDKWQENWDMVAVLVCRWFVGWLVVGCTKDA